MSSDDEREEIRSLTRGRQKKPRAKTTFTYKVGDPSVSSNYGSITKSPNGPGSIKILGGKNKLSTVSSESDISVTHCHENFVREPDSNKKARKTLIIASGLCLFFMIVEVIGGYFAHSLAIMTDAAHLLSDFASFMISLISLFMASRPATRRMSFGWHRAEVIGAVVSVLTIWLLTGILVYVAIERIINKTYDVEPVPMVVTASVGVCVNLIMGFVLHKGGHTHSHGGAPARPAVHGDGDHGHSHDDDSTAHGHSHDGKPSSHGHSHDGDSSSAHGHSHGSKNNENSTYQGGHPQAPIDRVYAQSEGTWIEIGDPSEHPAPDTYSISSTGLLIHDEEDFAAKKGFPWPWKRGPKKNRGPKNINIRAALVHVIGDFFQSIGILIAALIIYFRPDLGIMDPICTFIFSVLVLITTINVMRDALNVLMEGLPRGMSFNEVAVALQSLHGVMKVHDLRIWSLTMDKVALSVHLAVEGQANTQDVLREATHMLRERFRVYECTVQIEHYINAMDECKSCEGPQR